MITTPQYKYIKKAGSTIWTKKPLSAASCKRPFIETSTFTNSLQASNANIPPLPTEDLSPYDWSAIARPSQQIPLGDWRTWLIMAGRGFGKTRTGAETIRHWVKTMACRRIALVGDTEYDVEEVMVRGHSGLLNIHPEAERPTYCAYKRKVTWPCGAIALLYTARTYERLRGPQFDGAWVDELAKFPRARETWDQLMFCMRLGPSPRVIVTTTPRPLALLKTLQNDPTTVLTRGSTYDNAANLAPAFVQQIIKQYEGTKLGSQEIEGHLFSDEVGFLWQAQWIRYGTDDKVAI